MNYSNLSIEKSEINKYVSKIINKIYATLGIYEDCCKINNMTNYHKYTNRISVEILGFYHATSVIDILSVYNIFLGLRNTEDIEHKDVKSAVFHCISLMKKVGE